MAIAPGKVIKNALAIYLEIPLLADESQTAIAIADMASQTHLLYGAVHTYDGGSALYLFRCPNKAHGVMFGEDEIEKLADYFDMDFEPADGEEIHIVRVDLFDVLPPLLEF